jgi:hypothetical protein
LFVVRCSFRQAGFDRLTSTSSVTAATTGRVVFVVWCSLFPSTGSATTGQVVFVVWCLVFGVPFDYAQPPQGECCLLLIVPFDKLSAGVVCSSGSTLTRAIYLISVKIASLFFMG